MIDKHKLIKDPKTSVTCSRQYVYVAWQNGQS